MAALSLVEGDAVLLQTNYMLSGLTKDELQALLIESEEAESRQFENAPEFIKEDLLFPYLEGFTFAMTRFGNGGWQSVNQMYDDLPQSTEQILHPEKYVGERDEPQEVTLPDLATVLGSGWTRLDTDVLGELYVRIYLDTHVVEATSKAAAAGWDGDRYAYLKNDAGDGLLVWESVWDSQSDAREFFEAYGAFMHEKDDGAWDLAHDGQKAKTWVMDGAAVFAGWNGSGALLVIAPDEAAMDQVLTAFPEFSAVPAG